MLPAAASKTRLTALLPGLFGASALALAGCTGFVATASDQQKSLQELGQTTVLAPLHVPEHSAGVLRGLAPNEFLHMVAVGVFSLRDADASERLQTEFAAIAEDRRDPGLTERERIARLAGGQGSGVAVTSDGYLATVAHVVSHANVIVAYLDLTAGGVTVRTMPARIVFVDRQADFAVLKCEFATPRLLAPPTEVMPASTLAFGGGWWNQKGAGRGLRSQELCTRTGHRYHRLRTSIPLVAGDSGPAVADRDGRLLGIAVDARSWRFWRMAPASDAVMLDATDLRRLIEADRANRR